MAESNCTLLLEHHHHLLTAGSQEGQRQKGTPEGGGGSKAFIEGCSELKELLQSHAIPQNFSRAGYAYAQEALRACSWEFIAAGVVANLHAVLDGEGYCASVQLGFLVTLILQQLVSSAQVLDCRLGALQTVFVNFVQRDVDFPRLLMTWHLRLKVLNSDLIESWKQTPTIGLVRLYACCTFASAMPLPIPFLDICKPSCVHDILGNGRLFIFPLSKSA
eukprot:4191474-Amphidinium_carterae.1